MPKRETKANPCNNSFIFIELLNMSINTLKISNIHSQQNLNKPKGALRHKRPTFVDFSFGEWFVEKMLRTHLSIYKHLTISICQINKFLPTTKPYATSSNPRSVTSPTIQCRAAYRNANLTAQRQAGRSACEKARIQAIERAEMRNSHKSALLEEWPPNSSVRKQI